MIGWASRSSRDGKRRDRWWASLTDDQKALERRRERVADRWFFGVMTGVLVYFAALWFLTPTEWADRHRLAVMGLWLLGHPGGMVIGVVVGNLKKRRVP